MGLLAACSRAPSAERSTAEPEAEAADTSSFPALDFGDDETSDAVRIGVKPFGDPIADKCGGVGHIGCAHGWVCRIQPDGSSDPMGVCLRDGDHTKRSAVGERCGGIAGFECREGLTCKLDETEQTDRMGTCIYARPGAAM